VLSLRQRGDGGFLGHNGGDTRKSWYSETKHCGRLKLPKVWSMPGGFGGSVAPGGYQAFGGDREEDVGPARPAPPPPRANNASAPGNNGVNAPLVSGP
jgi:hypothetical protein